MRRNLRLGSAMAAMGLVVIGLGPVARAQSVQVTATYNAAFGSGCPKNGKPVAYLNNGTDLVLGFGQLIAQVPTANGGLVDHKSCDIFLQITPPPGKQYRITRVLSGGSASIQPGAIGVQLSSYRFQLGPTAYFEPLLLTNDDAPPPGQSWFKAAMLHSNPRQPDGVWSVCGTNRDLIITESVTASNKEAFDPTETSSISQDFSWYSTFFLEFRDCN
jgi:hypothetical protein